MNTVFKKLLCGIAVFLSSNAPLSVLSTPNIDGLRGFEAITQIPDYLHPYAGAALLRVIPAYLATLDSQHAEQTKRLLHKLFICPNPEITTTHILPRTGEFQIARFITPEIAGKMLAITDFCRSKIQRHLQNKNQVKLILNKLADDLRQTITSGKLPEETVYLKLNRNFVNAFMGALEECCYFSSDSQNAPIIANFAPQALLAFICLKATDRNLLTDYCIAYQEEKNRLENREVALQCPALITTHAPSRKKNVFLMWNSNKATSDSSIFIESLTNFLKSTFHEVAPMVEIPDVTTRGTSYPVCIETLLHCLTQFTLNSQTFQGTAAWLTHFFNSSSKENLEQHVIDFSEPINNLAGVVYEQLITHDSVIYRTSKKFNLDAEITGFVHLNCPLSEENIRNFFSSRQDFEFIKQQDNIIFIRLGNKVLGIYDASQAYGVAIQALLSNVIICLVKLFEVDFNLDLSQLIANTGCEKEVFDILAPLLGWNHQFQSTSDNSEPWSIAVSNNKGGLVIHITSCHGFCTHPTGKSRLRGKANAYALDCLKSYHSPSSSQNSEKLLTLLNSLAPWDLSRLITTPTNVYKSAQKGGPIAQNGSELPEALARHLYLGQEVNDMNCMNSIIDILGHPNGNRLSDIVNFFIQRLKSSLSDDGKNHLRSAISTSLWIENNPELKSRLINLLT